MRRMDPEKNFQYFRMLKNRFDHLVHRLGPFIKHQRTTNQQLISNFLVYTDATNEHNTRYITPNFTDSPSASGEPQPGEWRRQVAGDTNLLPPGRLSACGARATRVAFAVRNDLMGFFQSPQGLVSWQDAVIRRGQLN
ncbi:hypothetical protein AAFF_G00022060 [Aldrovandia affinis]|uniref:Uncharacterized protein n=1 Tax=Aldrovandia affinis TaxID=143900 RepID=A0AAD7WGP0_9TELE|nr:hypothetical protein AAFF_G00022060 [Aldrovandia affinis]